MVKFTSIKLLYFAPSGKEENYYYYLGKLSRKKMKVIKYTRGGSEWQAMKKVSYQWGHIFRELMEPLNTSGNTVQ